jgi:hypothetical protein
MPAATSVCSSFFSYYIGGAGPSSFNMENLVFDWHHLIMHIPVTFAQSVRKVKALV